MFVHSKRKKRIAAGGPVLDLRSELQYAFADPAKHNRRFDAIGAADNEELLTLPPDVDISPTDVDARRNDGELGYMPPQSHDLL